MYLLDNICKLSFAIEDLVMLSFFIIENNILFTSWGGTGAPPRVVVI